jgi:hypothetical protein
MSKRNTPIRSGGASACYSGSNHDDRYGKDTGFSALKVKKPMDWHKEQRGTAAGVVLDLCGASGGNHDSVK